MSAASYQPKSHIIEAHACQQQAQFGGIGDLEDSFGERNYLQKKADVRHAGTGSFKTREIRKAKEDRALQHPGINRTKANIKESKKRKQPYAQATARQQEATAKRQRKLEARERVLLLDVPVAAIPRLRDLKKAILCDEP